MKCINICAYNRICVLFKCQYYKKDFKKITNLPQIWISNADLMIPAQVFNCSIHICLNRNFRSGHLHIMPPYSLLAHLAP